MDAVVNEKTKGSDIEDDGQLDNLNFQPPDEHTVMFFKALLNP